VAELPPVLNHVRVNTDMHNGKKCGCGCAKKMSAKKGGKKSGGKKSGKKY